MNIKTVAPAIALLLGTYFLGFHVQQSQYSEIIIGFSIMMAGYLLLLRTDTPLIILLAIAIIARLILLPSFPFLSDDIYRFFWDAELISSGHSPYSMTPSEFQKIDLGYAELFSQLNSPDYYSVYPPLSQGLFYISSQLGSDIYGMAVVLKLIYLCIEVVGMYFSIKLLSNLNMDNRLAAMYYLNPLVVIEGIGNLHIEILVSTSIAMTLYFLYHHKYVQAGFAFAGGIAVKVVPLLIAPIMAFSAWNKKKLLFIMVTAIIAILTFSPLLVGMEVGQFSQSLDLYFRKFEFNGSLYYLLRYIGYQWEGYNLINIIGPGLSIAIVALVGYLVYARRQMIGSFPQQVILPCFLAWIGYLLCSTTIHPWYLIPILYLSIYTRFRFAILWSFLIVLTYINYSYQPYLENLWVVALEYIVLMVVMIYEGFFSRKIWKGNSSS